MAIGVGTVEDDDGLLIISTCLQETTHGDVIGVKTQSYILDVNQEDVELTHGGNGGTGGLAIIQGEDGDAGLAIYLAAYMLASIGGAPEAMLGGEKGGDTDAVADEAVEEMFAIRQQGGVIAKEGYTLATE